MPNLENKPSFMESVFQNITIDDLKEVLNTDGEAAKLGDLEIPCELAKELKDSIESAPVPDDLIASMSGIITAIQTHTELSSSIDAGCSLEQIEAGAKQTPAPTPSEPDKAESMSKGG